MILVLGSYDSAKRLKVGGRRQRFSMAAYFDFCWSVRTHWSLDASIES